MFVFHVPVTVRILALIIVIEDKKHHGGDAA